MYEDTIRGNASFSVDDAVDDAFSNYLDDFEAVYGFADTEPPEDISFDDWRDLRQIHGVAQKIAQIGATLLRRKGFGDHKMEMPDVLATEADNMQANVHQLLKVIRDTQPDLETKAWFALLPYLPNDPRTRNHVFKITLQVEAAKLFETPYSKMATRLRELARCAVVFPGSDASEYLSRAARCYVLDMPPEFAVMGRAVLDTALGDLYSYKDVIDEVGSGKGDHVGLTRFIECAVSKGLFDEEVRVAAHVVKDAGDAAAHGRLDEVPAIDVLLDALATVLKSIAAGSSS